MLTKMKHVMNKSVFQNKLEILLIEGYFAFLEE